MQVTFQPSDRFLSLSVYKFPLGNCGGITDHMGSSPIWMPCPDGYRTYKNVSIGDKFVAMKDSRSKRVSTVIDFIERRSVTTGKVIDYECVAKQEFLGQTIVFETPFATVVRNRISKASE